MRTRQMVSAIMLAGTVAAAATACGTAPTTPSMNSRITVTASTDVWGSIAQVVGGSWVNVTSIIDDPAKDPHAYELKPSDLAAIANADVVLYNGGGYDDFFAKAAKDAGKQGIIAYDLAGKSGQNANEHVFYDLSAVQKVADQLAMKFSAVQSVHAADFTANAQRFDADVAGLLAKAQGIGTQHPGKSVVVTEPVADYLLDAAGVKDATPSAFEKAVEDDTDIPAEALAQATGLIQKKSVAALVNNAQTVTDTTRQLAATATSSGVPVVNVTETLPAGTTDYVAWMGKEIDDLAKALNT